MTDIRRTIVIDDDGNAWHVRAGHALKYDAQKDASSTFEHAAADRQLVALDGEPHAGLQGPVAHRRVGPGRQGIYGTSAAATAVPVRPREGPRALTGSPSSS
jgi:hypothetical protein